MIILIIFKFFCCFVNHLVYEVSANCNKSLSYNHREHKNNKIKFSLKKDNLLLFYYQVK